MAKAAQEQLSERGILLTLPRLVTEYFALCL